jgi:hypothetical protein
MKNFLRRFAEINILMLAVTTHQGRTYHRFFAWVPTRMRSGRLVWLCHYYMRPDSNGWGLLLTRREYLQDQIKA